MMKIRMCQLFQKGAQFLRKHARGQGLVETALTFPVLLIVISGLIEFGFMMNEYMALQDASRNAARYASDGLFYNRDSVHDCDNTLDFYRQTACLVNRELARERPEISLDLSNAHDDIVVSAFSVASGGGGTGVSARHPTEYAESGWSEALDSVSWGTRNRSSNFTTDDINARLRASAPSTGLVLVEIFYDYQMKLGLPWITAFIPNPVSLHAYAIMPLVSAEPTSTPIP